MADPVAAFIDGAFKGYSVRKGWKQQEEDRAERRRLAEQDQIYRKEDRAFALEDRDYRRKERDEDRAWAREDREFRRQEAIAERAIRQRELASRLAFASQDQAWQNEQRARERAGWQREDALRNDITAATTAATDAYQADQAGPPPAAPALSPFISRKVEGEANPFVERALAPLMGPKKAEKPRRKADPLDYFYEVAAPKIEAAYMKAGEMEKAAAFAKWREDEGVKRGMASYGRAVAAAQKGDEGAFLDHLTEAYNNQGYYGDGITVVREKSGFTKDKAGNVLGARLTFRDEASGETWTQDIGSETDLYRLGLGMMAPETVFARAIEAVDAADKARMTKAAGASEADEAYRKRLASKIETLAGSDMQFVSLPPAEQVARAQALLDEEDRAIAGRGQRLLAPPQGVMVPPAAQAGPPPMIWRGD